MQDTLRKFFHVHTKKLPVLTGKGHWESKCYALRSRYIYPLKGVLASVGS